MFKNEQKDAKLISEAKHFFDVFKNDQIIQELCYFLNLQEIMCMQIQRKFTKETFFNKEIIKFLLLRDFGPNLKLLSDPNKSATVNWLKCYQGHVNTVNLLKKEPLNSAEEIEMRINRYPQYYSRIIVTEEHLRQILTPKIYRNGLVSIQQNQSHIFNYEFFFYKNKREVQFGYLAKLVFEHASIFEMLFVMESKGGFIWDELANLQNFLKKCPEYRNLTIDLLLKNKKILRNLCTTKVSFIKLCSIFPEEKRSLVQFVCSDIEYFLKIYEFSDKLDSFESLSNEWGLHFSVIASLIPKSEFFSKIFYHYSQFLLLKKISFALAQSSIEILLKHSQVLGRVCPGDMELKSLQAEFPEYKDRLQNGYDSLPEESVLISSLPVQQFNCNNLTFFQESKADDQADVFDESPPTSCCLIQ